MKKYHKQNRLKCFSVYIFFKVNLMATGFVLIKTDPQKANDVYNKVLGVKDLKI